jgi:tetratricopeptide (TPR) repeat protein
LQATDVARAAEPLAFAVLLAERTKDRASLRRALSVQSLVRSSLRDSFAALQGLARSADLAEELGDHIGLANAWNNIGLVFVEAKLNHDARAAFEKALRLAGAASTDPRFGYICTHALHGVAIASNDTMDYEAAIQAAERAIVMLAEPETREMQQLLALTLGLYARLLLVSNRLPDAEVQAQRCNTMAAGSGSARARSDAQLTQALILSHKGKYAAALAILRELLAEDSRGMPGAYLNVLKYMIVVHERAGRYDAAVAAYGNYLSEVQRSRFQLIHARADASLSEVRRDSATTEPRIDSDLPALTALAQRVRNRLGSSSQMTLFLA